MKAGSAPPILVVHWGRTGGGPRFAFNMARGLSSHVDVFVSYNSDSEIAPEWRATFPERHEIKTYRSSLGVVFSSWRLLIAVMELRRLVRRHGIVLVYSPMFHIWFSVVGWLIAGKRAHLLESVHDATPHPGEESRIQTSLQAFSRGRADRIATYSDTVRDALIGRGVSPDKIVALRHGIDITGAVPRPLRPLGPGETYTVLFLGRIHEYKGINLFVETLQALVARGFPVRGVVRGSGYVDPRVVSASSEFLTWHVKWIPERQVGELVRQADLLLLPYIEASQSGVLSQAAAYGTPAVVTPVGGLAEQARAIGNAVIASSIDAHDVANSVERILTAPDLYCVMSASGLDAAAGAFSWRTIAKELLDSIPLPKSGLTR